MSKSILIVDDSSTMRQQLTVFLESHGFSVVEASDGIAGVAAAKVHNVDMIITDINMPRMDGLEFVKQVRAIPIHATTPIFVLTTDSAKESMSIAKKSGATAWIIKPFKPEILLKGIRKVLAM